jgi:undecaprenyl-diphosphatase
MPTLTGRWAYPLLFLLVAAESAGVPVPGEAAVITAGVLSGTGRLWLPYVIGVAALAAIVGDNVGYVLGRKGARRLLTRGRKREQVLQRGEAFFERHGGKAIFLGRWVMGVRVVIAWTAGASDYPWGRFFLWNAAGAICWAASIATLAHVLGAAAKRDLGIAGFSLLGLVLLGAAVYGAVWLWRRRVAGNVHSGGRPSGEQPPDA